MLDTTESSQILGISGSLQSGSFSTAILNTAELNKPHRTSPTRCSSMKLGRRQCRGVLVLFLTCVTVSASGLIGLRDNTSAQRT
jgi:hypothetical protein